MADVVVVGGGIAGLTAAAFAARAGAKVVLLEGAPQLGGRARTREERGFRFNLGPHALYLGGAAKRTLDALGIDPPGAAPVVNGAFLAREGKLFAMPMGPEGDGVAGLLDAHDRRALIQAFGDIYRGFSVAPGETVAAALRRLTANEPARAVLAAQIRVATYSNAPEIADASAVFDQLRLVFAGVRYLDDGWAAMVAALAAAARQAGVTIRCEARVESVANADARWRVTGANGEGFDADAVVLAVEPKHAASLAPGVKALRHAAETAIPVRAASLDVALSSLPRSTHSFAQGLDEPTYFSVHSLGAKRLAPDGGALIHVSYYLAYLAPEDRPSPALRARLEALLDLMQPGWRDVRVAEQWLPLTMVTYDMPQAGRGGVAGRAPVTAAPGLFVAGDWVGGEGMLSDAAFASGRLAGENAAARLGEIAPRA